MIDGEGNDIDVSLWRPDQGQNSYQLSRWLSEPKSCKFMFKHLFKAHEGELIEIQSEWVFGGDLRSEPIPEALLHPQFSLTEADYRRAKGKGKGKQLAVGSSFQNSVLYLNRGGDWYVQGGHHDFASSIDDARQSVHCCSLVSLLVPDPVVGCEKATSVDQPSQERSSAPALSTNWVLGVWTWLAVGSGRWQRP